MAADRQISQLVLQVDANIAVAQRSLQDLARTVNQTSGQMNTALGSTSAAHGKLNQAFNQTRLAQMELSHVMTASVDAYAAGSSPLRILTLEMGRVAQAASFMGGGTGVMGKLGAFMSGPWGIAVLLATSVLGQLISRMGQGTTSVADLVEKMREHAKEAEKSKLADEAWANSIDGLIDRNEKLVESLQKRLKAEEDIALQELQGAKRDEAKAEQAVKDAQTKLNNLLQQRGASGQAVGIGQGGSPTGASSALSGEITQAREELATAQRAVGEAQAAIQQSTISVGEEQGKALASSSAAVDLWAKRYVSALHGIEQTNHGALAGSTETLTASFETLKKSMGDAAGAGASKAFYSARNQAKDLGVQLEKGKITVADYAAQMLKLAASLDKAAEAARKAKSGSSSVSSGEYGRQVSFADATAIAKGAGLTVTSGYRSEAKQAELYRTVRTAENPVAKPGTSAHEGVNGKWALDIAFAPGLTAQGLKKLYGDQGVSLSAVYKESGHFHIEGRQTQTASAKGTRSAPQDRSAQKQATDDDAFARESAQLDAEILQAKHQLAEGFDTQAQYADDEIDAQKKALLDSIQKQQDGKAISKDQADALRVQAEDLATARKALVARQEYLDKLRAQAASQQQVTDFAVDDLKFADEMAKTQSEHRTLQLQILDIQYKQKEADLERLLVTIQSNKDFATSLALQQQALDVQGQIARIPIDRAHDQTRVHQGTLNPLQSYTDNLPRTADDINQAISGIEASGLEHVVDLVGDFGKGWKTVRDDAIQALQDIESQLLKLGAREILGKLFKATKPDGGSLATAGTALNVAGTQLTTAATIWQGVAAQIQAAAASLATAGAASGGAGGGAGGLLSMLGGGGGGGGLFSLLGGGSAATGYAGLDGLGSLFGGGAAAGGLGTGFVGLDGLGFADGGFVSGSGSATSDSIPAMLSNGEYVMSANAVQKFGPGFLDAMNEGRVPHKKHGGLLGFLGSSGLFGLAGLFATGGLKHLNPLALLSPGLALATSKSGAGDALGLLSPVAFLASKLLDQKQSRISIPKAANSNTAGGDTYHIHVVAPNTGDPLKDRQTGMQFAAGIEMGMSNRRRKGIAG